MKGRSTIVEAKVLQELGALVTNTIRNIKEAAETEAPIVGF